MKNIVNMITNVQISKDVVIITVLTIQAIVVILAVVMTTVDNFWTWKKERLSTWVVEIWINVHGQ